MPDDIKLLCEALFDWRMFSGLSALPMHSAGFLCNKEMYSGFRELLTLDLKGASSPVVWLEYQSILSAFDSAPTPKPRLWAETKHKGSYQFRCAEENQWYCTEKEPCHCFVNENMQHCAAHIDNLYIFYTQYICLTCTFRKLYCR